MNTSRQLLAALVALVALVALKSTAFGQQWGGAQSTNGNIFRMGDVGIGTAHGTRVVATLTGMDQPLGTAVGNANEIAESLDVLAGSGPADVVELTYSLGADMLVLGGIAPDHESALQRLKAAVGSGAAMEKFQEVIAAQDGNPDVAEDRSLLPSAPLRFEQAAPESGFVTECDARDIGVAGVRLGAGRERKEDSVDHGVSISVLAKVGARVDRGDLLAVVDYRDEDRLAAARPLLERAWKIGDSAAEPELIIGHVS